MTRASITSALRTELTGLDVRVVYLLKIDFAGGAITTCTGNGPVTYGGDTYLPDGTFLEQSGIEESNRPIAASFKLFPSDTLKARVAAGGYRRKRVYFYQAILDSDYQIISAWSAGTLKIGGFRLQRSRDSYLYEMKCISGLNGGDRAHPVYASNAMQQQRYPGDTYMKGSAANTVLEFEWGGSSYQAAKSFGCVSVDERIDGKRAGDIKAGDVMRIADPDTLEEAQAEVLYSELSIQEGVRIATDRRSLVCSASAPIATDEGMIRAKHLLNYFALTEGGEYERVISVGPLGEIPVQHIYLGEKCFWVNGFLHHNKKDPRVGGSVSSDGSLRPLGPGSPNRRYDFISPGAI